MRYLVEKHLKIVYNQEEQFMNDDDKCVRNPKIKGVFFESRSGKMLEGK